MINNRYIIENKVGEGRSKVFLCRDTEAGGKKLAIKILADSNADKNEIISFRAEYFILKNLSHPNIINVYELGYVITSDDEGISYGCYFFTMDYFPGNSLDEVNIEPEKFNSILTQICSVLFYLHQANYIYYDLKPENILIDSQQVNPEIKFIDFGFAEHLPDTKNYQPKGTAQYIAPEILKKQQHDFRVDIYSLGILLYKLIYSKYPFDVEDELQIYKAHLELEFDFPDCNFDNKIPGVLRTVLAKDPAERYDSVLKILIDLEIPLTDAVTKDFIPAKVFTNRRDILAMLRKYISDESSHEVFSIRGYESMGKTFLTEELTRIYDDVILISESRASRGIEFIRSVMKRIYYHEPTYRKLSEPAKTELSNFANTQNQIAIEDLKKLFHRLSSETNFILVFDSFNLYDEVSQELLRELIPFLQVNKRKVILTEESELNYTSEFLNNLQEINISAFTDANLSEYLTKNFYYLYPAEELRKLILRYADLSPGSIEGFVKDIHLFGLVDYKTGYPKLETNEESIQLLKSSHNEIYAARLKILSETELEFVQLMSLFEFPVQVEIIKSLMQNNDYDETQLLSNLERKNILQHYQSNGEPVLSSSGMKKYIYSTIKNISELHGNIAFKLRENRSNISRTELSRQFELAGLFDESYEILKVEIESAEIQSAHSYQKQMLLHLLEMPLNVSKINEIKFSLLKTLSKLNEYPSIIRLCDEIDAENLSIDSQKEIVLLKAKAFIGTGDLTNARELLYTALDDAKTEYERIKIFVEIAYIEYDLTGLDKARQLCEAVLNNQNAAYEYKGKAYNLIGLIAYSHDDDFEFALENFKKASVMYEQAGQILSKLKIEINIGNILFLRGDIKEGMEFWYRAQQTNLSVGNMEYEALITMNFGAFNFSRGKYEEAEENYSKARSVFVSIGNKLNYCSTLINLSEIYIETCAFDEATKCLMESNRTIYALNNFELEADTNFTFGKLYFYLGDNEALMETISVYENIVNKVVLSDRYYNNFNSLKLLIKLNTFDLSLIEEFNKVTNSFLDFDDKYNYIKFSFILVSYLIKSNCNKEALIALMSNTLISSCKGNMVHEAERLYWLGILSNSVNDGSLESANHYFNEAYQIMQDHSITDLTWKILFALAGYYKTRGNELKFEEYFNYSKSVLNFIIQQIKNVNLRSKYLNKSDRKSFLNKIDIWENKL